MDGDGEVDSVGEDGGSEESESRVGGGSMLCTRRARE